VPGPINSMIRLLLTKDDKERMNNCCSIQILTDIDPSVDNRTAVENKFSLINYDKLRTHPIFKCFTSATNDNFVQFNTVSDVSQSQLELNNQKSTSTVQVNSVIGGAVRIPLLRELCVRAVGAACILIADLTASNGGSRPDVKWIQVSLNHFYNS
jgi:hypothetical protein